jgi:hypothetical protein
LTDSQSVAAANWATRPSKLQIDRIGIMKEIVRIIRRDFDVLGNDRGNTITEQCIATFIEENGVTAHRLAKDWLQIQEPIKLYLAWDGEVYPKFLLTVEQANKKTRTKL